MESIGLIWHSDGTLNVDTPVVILPEVKVTPEAIISAKGVDLIKHFESLHDGDKQKPGLQPQKDPIGIWTVGYGHVLRDKNGRMLKGDVDKDAVYRHELANLTERDAETLLRQDLYETYLPEVLKNISRRDLNADQWGALTSFCYNCGTHYINSAGRRTPYAIWANVERGIGGKALYDYWKGSVTRAGGKVLPGLVRRRKAEAYLFIKGENNFYPPDEIKL